MAQYMGILETWNNRTAKQQYANSKTAYVHMCTVYKPHPFAQTNRCCFKLQIVTGKNSNQSRRLLINVCVSKLSFQDTDPFSWHLFQLPGDRLHEDRQVFPWSASRWTRGQTTQGQISLPLEPLSEYRETSYIQKDKPSSGTLSECTTGQTT